jgi:hypothetical protein
MARALVRDAGLVGLLHHPSVRGAGDDGREARAGEARDAGEFRSRRHHHGAALAHIAHDVLEIARGQDALVGVAVEDDEVEFLDLLLEQLAGREGDERELVDGRAVLLFRRAQDGEVDEVHIGVGLEQVAPGALARMGLAGDEEHAQLLADALDGDHRLVVGLRELAFQRLGFELHHVGAAVIDAHLQGEGRAGAHGEALEDLPVAAHGDGGGTRAAAFQDLGPDGLVPADDAEARRLDQLDLPVALVRAPGHEGVERRAKAHGVHGGRNRDHAVRDLIHGEPVRGTSAGVGERREQAGAVVAFRRPLR